MAKADVLDILRMKQTSPLEFHFDNLWIPPIQYYLTPQDIEGLRQIATSIKLSSKIREKYKMIDAIMKPRGFKRFSAGTNRIVYSFSEDTRFVVKIAVDKVGMQDNPREYENQFAIKPFCAKMFYTSPCGTVGFAERVLPIKNRDEFKEIADDVFSILVNQILGLYVMEDVGTNYFMNWGIRPGFGPVLLDAPYLYKLDGNKLHCTKFIPEKGGLCDGEIDYDAGFNHLVCQRCGKIYLASDLRDNSIENKIIIKGGTQMKIAIKEGDKIYYPEPVDDVMVRPAKKPEYKAEGLKVAVREADGTIRECYDKPNGAEIDVSNPVPGLKVRVSDDVSINEIGVEPSVITPPDIPNADVEVTATEENAINDDEDENDGDKREECETGADEPEVSAAEDVPSPEQTDSEGVTDDCIVEVNTQKDEESVKTEFVKTRDRDERGRFISTKSSNKKKSSKGPKMSSTFIPAE